MLEAYFFAYGRVDAILLGCDGRWAYVDSGYRSDGKKGDRKGDRPVPQRQSAPFFLFLRRPSEHHFPVFILRFVPLNVLFVRSCPAKPQGCIL